ncbi:MAG: hypothetical protein IJ111_15330 [Eggerthellaceae bacterium]|nr:hypothetical protein [Eggerthellaceae bacterium]MBQ9044175.1 hypothetical protein [Eggerthellaceae bacterium]
MKKTVSIILAFVLACMGLPACSSKAQISSSDSQKVVPVADIQPEKIDIAAESASMNFADLSDPKLQRFIEDTVYAELIDQIDTDKYFIENVEATYVSKEYLDELAYNSQTNIYFGFSLADLEEAFEGQKYIFTLGEDGHTAVKVFEEYDDTYDQVIRNVAIGAGVILVCVTISAVTAGAGVPAASMIFAVSAKSGAVAALSGGAISGGFSALVTGLETGDPEAALKAAALSGSEGFMWGAIGGALFGGAGEARAYSNALKAFKGAELNGITAKEAAIMQRESKYPLDLIKQFKSVDEYNVYRQAGLKTKMVSGRTALVRDIDLKYKSLLPDGKTEVTNLERMARGYAPIDPATGKAYQLHHIGQKADGTLAVLTEAEHQGNSAILNTIGQESEIDRAAFDKIREEFWKSYAAYFM